MNYPITDFGARPDGSLSTGAIQAAIDACYLAGGGEVVVPEGRFLTGGIRLRSRVTLRLLDGACLLGVRDPEEYTRYLEDAVEPISEEALGSTAPTAVEGYTARSIQPFSRWNNAIIRAIGAHDIAIVGDHNVENYLAAISAVWGYVGADSIIKVAHDFKGVEHRIEFVREVEGVKYYNDSIASSPTRTIACLKAFKDKLILLAGGYDKHIPFEPMAPYVVDKVKLLILNGPTADKIEAAVKADPNYTVGNPQIVRVKNFEEAVMVAHEMAAPGDTVALSPACASFDAYPNFVARGKHFKELVEKL